MSSRCPPRGAGLLGQSLGPMLFDLIARDEARVSVLRAVDRVPPETARDLGLARNHIAWTRSLHAVFRGTRPPASGCSLESRCGHGGHHARARASVWPAQSGASNEDPAAGSQATLHRAQLILSEPMLGHSDDARTDLRKQRFDGAPTATIDRRDPGLERAGASAASPQTCERCGVGGGRAAARTSATAAFTERRLRLIRSPLPPLRPSTVGCNFGRGCSAQTATPSAPSGAPSLRRTRRGAGAACVAPFWPPSLPCGGRAGPPLEPDRGVEPQPIWGESLGDGEHP